MRAVARQLAAASQSFCAMLWAACSRATAEARMGMISDYSGKQPGDPARACRAIIAVAETPDPPRHLVLGKQGFDGVTARLKACLAEIEAQKDVSLAADFPAVEA